MSQIYLMGLADDPGLGDAGMPPDFPGVSTATQARNLDRQMMQARPTGLLNRMASGLDANSSRISALGDQAVQLIDAATRVKLATKATQKRVRQSLDTYRNPVPVFPEDDTQEAGALIPGVKNQHLLIGAGVLLAVVLLMNRRGQ